MKEIRNIP